MGRKTNLFAILLLVTCIFVTCFVTLNSEGVYSFRYRPTAERNIPRPIGREKKKALQGDKSSTTDAALTHEHLLANTQTKTRNDGSNQKGRGIKNEPKTLKKIKRRIFHWNESKGTMKSLPLDGTLENKTGERVIFNRVPKCGSRSVLDVFNHLAKAKQYNMINSKIYGPLHLPEEKKNLITNVILRAETPVLFQRHMHFIDFGNSSHVKYINIIRDPIERFTSNYYFKRFGDEKKHMHFRGSDESKYQTINDCVLKHQPECSGSTLQYILPFFCGHSPECSLPDSRVALEIAKYNVERDFLVVGLLDELDDTFMVLEKILPRLFKGAVNYSHSRNRHSGMRQKFVTKSKELPTEEVKSILLEEMSLEYEFYDFIKHRFHNLKASLGVKK